MGSFTKREQVVILLIVFTIILILGFKFILGDIIEAKNKTIDIEGNILKSDEEYIEDIDSDQLHSQTIMVHISGQVYQPGIVELEQGARVKDAVDFAGGN